MMDIILTKDERMEKLEKRLRALETKMERSFSRMNESVESLGTVMKRLQNENSELKSDRDFLLGKYKDLMQRADVTGRIRQAIGENAQLIKDLVLEDMDIEPGKKGMGDLLELAVRKKKIAAKAAAAELGVRENKVKFWALKLKDRGLVDVGDENGRFEIRKK